VNVEELAAALRVVGSVRPPAVCQEAAALLLEQQATITRLERWKSEASTVLDAWDAAYVRGTDMSDPFRNIIAEAIIVADRGLTARVPWLCPDCHGTGQSNNLMIDNCDHPAAPTVGKLLAIGQAMWKANGNVGYFTDPEYLPEGHAEAISSMLAYIITINPVVGQES
jgi:hypothetical protein